MPNIKLKSKQYLFKNKLNKRRKSKRELIKESFNMMLLGLFLLLINYFIPKKFEIFNSFNKNLIEIFGNLMAIFSNLLGIFLVLLICFSLLTSMFLILGSINRLVKVLLPRSKNIRFREY